MDKDKTSERPIAPSTPDGGQQPRLVNVTRLKGGSLKDLENLLPPNFEIVKVSFHLPKK